MGSSLDDFLTLSAGNTVSNFGGELVILHQQNFEFTDVVDGNLTESIGESVAGELGASVADLGHQALSIETSANTVIDTLGLTPVRLDTNVTVRFMAREATSVLLDNLHTFSGNENHV